VCEQRGGGGWCWPFEGHAESASTLDGRALDNLPRPWRPWADRRADPDEKDHRSGAARAVRNKFSARSTRPDACGPRAAS